MSKIENNLKREDSKIYLGNEYYAKCQIHTVDNI